MGQIKSLGNIAFRRIIGFVVFLLIIGALNLSLNYIHNDIYSSVVYFLNSSIWIIILFSLLLAAGEIFSILVLPYNLPGPLFSAVGSLFFVRFIFNVVEFIEKGLLKITFKIPLDIVYIVIAGIAFLVVLISGYVSIIFEIHSEKEEPDTDDKKNSKKKK